MLFCPTPEPHPTRGNIHAKDGGTQVWLSLIDSCTLLCCALLSTVMLRCAMPCHAVLWLCRSPRSISMTGMPPPPSASCASTTCSTTSSSTLSATTQHCQVGLLRVLVGRLSGFAHSVLLLVLLVA